MEIMTLFMYAVISQLERSRFGIWTTDLTADDINEVCTTCK